MVVGALEEEIAVDVWIDGVIKTMTEVGFEGGGLESLSLALMLVLPQLPSTKHC